MTAVVDVGADADVSADEHQQPSFADRLKSALSVQKISGVYVLLAMIVLFSIWVPETFLSWDTARQILNNNAVGAMAALALIVPLAAGVFDISVPYVMTLSGVWCAWVVVNTDLPLALAIVLAMAVAVGVGIVNGIVVVVFKIDSLIGTLATGFLVQALVKWRTGSKVVTSDELAGGFSRIARNQFLELTLPVFYALAIATVIWYLLEHTATGRRIYATGFNREATRLAGVRTARLQFGALVCSATLAGFAGIVLASQLGSGLSTAGDSYLLGAFAAVFLGATQLKNGRFNAWGTMIGVVLLGTGTTGLGLANQPQWVQDVFRGVVLIASLALTGLQVRKAGAGSKRSWLRRGPPAQVPPPDDDAGVAPASIPPPIHRKEPV
jgi:ribose transport system permease protein